MLRQNGCRLLARRCGGPSSRPLAAALGSLSTSCTCAPAHLPTVSAPAPLHVAARAISSRAPLQVPQRRFAEPKDATHEGLSYVLCPLCMSMIHLHMALFHIRNIHKDEDMAYWTKQVAERLALYEREIGIPLPPLTSPASSVRGTVEFDPVKGRANSGLSFSAGAALSREAIITACAPTVTAGGRYVCNWCTVRQPPFPTRDAFLLHVAKDHPLLDFDTVEALVQPPPTTQASSNTNTSTTTATATSSGVSTPPADGQLHDGHDTVDAVTQATAQWQPQPQESAASSPSAVRHAPTGGEAETLSFLSGPSRRVAGVRTVQQDNTIRITLPPRQSAQSISRTDTINADPIPLRTLTAAHPQDGSSGKDAAQAAGAIEFGEAHFPCELCLKVFSSEANLLQHAINKHLSAAPDTTASSEESKAGASAAAATGLSGAAVDTKDSPAASSTAASVAAPPSEPGRIRVRCDLCRSEARVFTFTNALIAHIRFRHPTKDAAAEAERMLAGGNTPAIFTCVRCRRGFSSAALLQRHLSAAHQLVVVENTGSGAEPISTAAFAEGRYEVARLPAGTKAGKSALPPLTSETKWWCHDCERGFRTYHALSAHQMEKHTEARRVIACPACPRVFNSPADLETHVRATHKDIRLADLGYDTHCTCTHCGRVFTTAQALHDHAVKHHGKNPASPVRSFKGPETVGAAEATPASAAAASVAPGEAAAPEAPAVDGPPKPRKVSRRKKVEAAES